jgi:CheY-like chemotaxis protein
MTILYADDDLDDCIFLSDAFRLLDPSITCITVSNGRQAIEQLNVTRQLPDYIFLDINMPVMSGKECLLELKKNEKFRDIPVVIYSTSADPAEINFYHRSGVIFLRKPNSFNKLCRILSEFLKNANSKFEYASPPKSEK